MNSLLSRAIQGFVALSLVCSYQIASAGTLTNVAVMPTSNVLQETTTHVASFRVATTGTVKTIQITYPAGFTLANNLIETVRATSSGSQSFLNGTLTASGQSLILTLTGSSGTSLSAGDTVKILAGNIVNSASLSNAITVTTKNSSGGTIDTGSTTLTLAEVITSMIADNSVTLSKLADLKSATYTFDVPALAAGECWTTWLGLPVHAVVVGIDLPVLGGFAYVKAGTCTGVSAERGPSGQDYAPITVLNLDTSNPFDPGVGSFTVWYLVSPNP